MGSSATAIVTGIVAAQGLHDLSRGRRGDDVDLGFANSLASRLEGHPDNASASVYGGATLSWTDDDGAGTTTVHLPVHPDVEPVVFAPDVQLSTAKARSVLPQQVRLADAAANSARAALLAHALGAAPEHLLAATREWLHQEARRSSYAGSMALVDRLRVGRARRRHLRRRALGAGAGAARPGRRGVRPRATRDGGCSPPASRRTGRGSRSSRAGDPTAPRTRVATVRRSGVATGARCYSGPCDRSRCRVSPVACRESPSTIWAAGQPCAAVPDVGSQ